MRLASIICAVFLVFGSGCTMPRPWKYSTYAGTCEPVAAPPTKRSQLFVTLRLPHCREGRTILTHYRSDSIGYASIENGRITLHKAGPWLEELKLRAGNRAPLIFIHGYNNSNEAALERASRLSSALKARRGDYPVVALTWPSYAGLAHYYWDEANAEWSAEGAARAVANLTREFPQSVLLAHSMGNRLALPAVVELRASGRLSSLRHFIMAAPDVDRQWLRRELSASGALGVETTIYVSLKDQPLSGSWRGHGYPRAGDFSWWVTGRDPFYAFAWLRGVQVVDTTTVDKTVKGHSYFIDTSKVTEDICRVVLGGGPARPGIEAMPDPRAPTNYVRVSKSAVVDDCSSSSSGGRT